MKKMNFKTVVRNCVATGFAIAALTFCWNGNVLITHAETAGEAIKATAYIRKEPSTNSESIGSVIKGDKVSIVSKTNASDGAVWYKVYVNGTEFGYIRSDLINITDGSTPPDEAAPAPGGSAAAGSVEALNPISATVVNANSVRVRSAANGSIVTSVEKDMTVTVTGRSNDGDGKTWYQVTFLENGNTVQGFIRYDYLSLQGDPTPATGEASAPAENSGTGEAPAPTESSDLPAVVKDYETTFNKDKNEWFLIDNKAGSGYSINDLFTNANQLPETWEKLLASQKKLKTQKIWTMLLAILCVALCGVIAFMVYKVKDVKDSAYFAAVEKETIRRKSENRAGSGRAPAKSGDGSKPKNVMMDLEDKPAKQGVRPTQGGQARPAQGGARPAQNGQARPAQNGQARPAQGGQARPAQGGQARPVQGGQARPVQGGQARPVQGGQARPVQGGQARPVQGGQARPVQGGQARPAQNGQARPAQGGQARPAQNGQARPAAPQNRDNSRLDDFDTAPVRTEKPKSNSNWKAKNFIQDDEFEYEFLNNDSDDELL